MLTRLSYGHLGMASQRSAMSWPEIPDQEQKNTGYRKAITTSLKAAVSLALLVFLFSRIEIGEVWHVLIDTRMDWLALAVLSFFLLLGAGVYRWQLLSRVFDFKGPYHEFARYFTIGLFFNLFLPTTVGGDVGRAYYLSKGKGRLVHAFFTVLADRGCAVGALVVIASVALVLNTAIPIPEWIVNPIFLMTIVLMLGGVLPFLFPKLFRRKGFPIQYWERPRIMFTAFALSIAMQMVMVGVTILLGFSVGIEIPIIFYFILTPIAIAVGAVPVSLNGLGVREGAAVYLLVLAGVNEAIGMAFALLWLFLLLFVGSIGGVVWVLNQRSPVQSIQA